MTKARLMRWIILSKEFDMKIRDKKGAENLAARFICTDLKISSSTNSRTKKSLKHFSQTLGSVTLQMSKYPMVWQDFANSQCGEMRYQGGMTSQKNKFFKVFNTFISGGLLAETIGANSNSKSSIQDSIGPPSNGCPMTLSARPFPSSEESLDTSKSEFEDEKAMSA
ncbi:hypothetical protein Tco_1042950 [Tanacetum coccineum]|uniref:Uncharacterized protein n=1 Tax=Tanacetum coccineum TaxID=301880 RepID=A0ABQ5GL66_9ASTR